MNLAIIEAGSIGREVAALWTKKGYHVTVTTRFSERILELSKVAQKCILLKETDLGELSSIMVNNDLILVTISADTPDEFEDINLEFAHAIRRTALERAVPRRLIYTSTTSIYGDHRGLWVDENSKLKLKSDQGQKFIEAERTLLSLKDLGWHLCILRLAEIYGNSHKLSERYQYLQGQSLVGSGKNYSNMVHHMDVISAVDFAQRRRLEGIFNIADDDHPTRQDLYGCLAEKLKLPIINWNPATGNWRGGNKRISNHKIKGKGFTFRFPHRIME